MNIEIELDHQIEIKFQKRNRTSGWTNILGLETLKLSEDEYTTMSKRLKKMFSCGAVVKVAEDGKKYVQMQGDHRIGVREFFIKNNIIDETNIKMSGA